MNISYSGLNTYLECRYKFFLHYFRKLRATEERSPLFFGTAIDNGINHLLETKDLDASIKIFHDTWASVEKTNIGYSKADLEEHLLTEEQLKEPNVKIKSWHSLNAKGPILIQEYNEQVMPLLKEVIKVQIDDVLKNQTGDGLVLKTDFIAKMHDDRVILFDNKTSSVKYEADSVKNSAQLATYYEALKDIYKLDACGYIVIPKKINKNKKPRVKIEIIIDNVSEQTIDKTFQDFDETLTNIKEARFEKNENACISKFGKCQYFGYCHGGSTEGLEEKK